MRPRKPSLVKLVPSWAALVPGTHQLDLEQDLRGNHLETMLHNRPVFRGMVVRGHQRTFYRVFFILYAFPEGLLNGTKSSTQYLSEVHGLFILSSNKTKHKWNTPTVAPACKHKIDGSFHTPTELHPLDHMGCELTGDRTKGPVHVLEDTTKLPQHQVLQLLHNANDTNAMQDIFFIYCQ